MKRKSSSDEIRSEYDFDYSKAIRGKYYKRAIAGPIIVALRPDRTAAKTRKRRSTGRAKASRK